MIAHQKLLDRSSSAAAIRARSSRRSSPPAPIANTSPTRTSSIGSRETLTTPTRTVTVQRDEEHNRYLLQVEDRSNGYPRQHTIGVDFVTAGRITARCSRTTATSRSFDRRDRRVSGARRDRRRGTPATVQAAAKSAAAGGEPARVELPAPRTKRPTSRLRSLDALVELLHRRRQEGRRHQPLQGSRRDESRISCGRRRWIRQVRTLLQVRAEDHTEADLMFTTLMGDQVEPRRKVHRGQRARREEPGRLKGLRFGTWDLIESRRNPESRIPDLHMADLVPQLLPVNIEDEMKRSYMDYAMSVIIGRALPDARDGLKPAHRRVLYGMKTMGLSPGRGYRKCAKIVGEVMGNFHPHGDASIYDTLVRMAQDFNMRYPLVDGQGNFGSIDARSAGGDAVYRGAPPGARRRNDDGSRQGDRRLHRRTTTRRRRSRRCCPRRFRISSSTVRLASRSAWPPTSRRTTCARSSTAASG